MRAYNLLMLMVLINAGMMLAVSMNIFGPTMAPLDDNWGIINETISKQHQIGPVSFTGIQVLAGVMIGAAFAALIPGVGSTLPGVGIAAFATIFLGSLLITIGMFHTIATAMPGLDWFINIYTLIQFLVFAYALIQMSSGGAKSSV